MSTYQYRDKRRQDITDALAALGDQQADLKKILEDEQSALQMDDWGVTDETFEAVASDWLWNHQPDFPALLNNDPVLIAKGAASSLTPEQVTAIRDASIPHTTTVPPANYLELILAAVDNDTAKLAEIIQCAHQAWLSGGEEKGDYPFDDVAVMLPVRLETLFDKPESEHNMDPERWKLSIRVIPDEASICRDNDFVSQDEIKALVAFWKAIQQPGVLSETWLDGMNAEVAWSQLGSRIRPERASWLVSNLELVIGADHLNVVLPPEMPEQAEPNRVGGIPPELNIFAVTAALIDGKNHHAVGRLPKDLNKQVDTGSLILELPSEISNAKESWWASWEKAKELGLGGEFLLDKGITPDNIEALYVVGIGDERPEEHFSRQSIAGELSVANLGTATNTVQGKNTGKPINWLKVTQTRLADRLHPVAQNNVGTKLQTQLTGKPDAIPIFPGSELPDDTQLSQEMVRALWPALWGEWLKDIWNMGDNGYRRGIWAFNNLCPEGPLMPLRIHDQPYGILPVTSLEWWQGTEGVAPDGVEQQKVETEIARLMNSLRPMLANASKNKRSVVGKTSREFMDLLGQPSRSLKYFGRNFLPSEIPIGLYKFSPAQQQQFREQAFKAYDPAITLMNKKPAEFYLCMGNGYKVRLPLIQTTNSLLRYRGDEIREPMQLRELIMLLINFPDAEPEVNYDLDEFFPNGGFVGQGLRIRFLPRQFIHQVAGSCLPDRLPVAQA